MKLLFTVIYIFLIGTVSVNASSKVKEHMAIHKIQFNSKSDRIKSFHMEDDGQFIHLSGIISKRLGVPFSNYSIKTVCVDQNDKIIDKDSTRISGSSSFLRGRTTANFYTRIKDHQEITKCDINVSG